MVQLFKSILPFSWMNFEDYFRKFEFLLSLYLQNIGGHLYFLKTRNAFFDHFKRFHHFWLSFHNLKFPSACFTQLVLSELRKTALIQNWFSLRQRWILKFWTALKQCWSALMFFMFSESALKSVKTLRQRCAELIISETSTREVVNSIWFKLFESTGELFWNFTFWDRGLITQFQTTLDQSKSELPVRPSRFRRLWP